MGFLSFMWNRCRRALVGIAILTTIAGISNGLMLVMVNTVSKSVADGDPPGPVSWGLFALAFAVYFLCNRLGLLRAVVLIERELKGLRLRMVDKIRRSEQVTIDRIKGGNLYNLLSQETDHLSTTFPIVADNMQQAVLLAASLIYLAILSPIALMVFVGSTAAGSLIYLRLEREIVAYLNLINRRRARLLDAIGDQIHGGKELRLRDRKAQSVFEAYLKTSRSLDRLMSLFGTTWANLMLLATFVVYTMLGIVALALPQVIDGHHLVVYQVVPVLILCMGPLTNLVGQWPMLLRADVSLKALAELEDTLDKAERVSSDDARAQAPRFRDFKTISATGLTYRHHGPDGSVTFQAGPLDLHLDRGEILFLVGGNGSGKSTMMRAFIGLYAAQSGVIAVDGVPVSAEARGGYRELFSAIFMDFHLFDRLYGLEGIDPDRVNTLLDQMGLAGKVTFRNGGFSTTALSTGQRKRLALVAALLEDKPVYVFDEWSAEQDVHFREAFYSQILPNLKARGTTVIAVTHDDRYWPTADRVIKLDQGKVEWERPGAALREDKA